MTEARKLLFLSSKYEMLERIQEFTVKPIESTFDGALELVPFKTDLSITSTRCLLLSKVKAQVKGLFSDNTSHIKLDHYV